MLSSSASSASSPGRLRPTPRSSASGADITFVNEEDALDLVVEHGSQVEPGPDGTFTFGPGNLETISTTREQLDYVVRELQGDPASESGSIDLSSCPADPDDDDDDDDPSVAPDAGV